MSIWKYSEKFNPQVSKDFQLTIGEGDTPLESYPELASLLGLASLHLKREDLNPTGSHKDRCLAFQMSKYIEDGQTELVISSSGNSAISAIAYSKQCRECGVRLHVYLSYKTPISKIERLNKYLDNENLINHTLVIGSSIICDNVIIHIEDRPKVMAFRFAKKNNLPFLRGSTDDFAIEGFKTIAFEIFEKAKFIDSLFIPTSSGTTAKGIYEGFKMLRFELPSEDTWKIPAIHIAQTSKIHPIAKEFDKEFSPSETSIAKAIVDRVAHRKSEILEEIIDTDGFGWVLDDEEIKEGVRVLRNAGVDCSEEGGLAMAALLKALKKGVQIDNPVVVITGTK